MIYAGWHVPVPIGMGRRSEPQSASTSVGLSKRAARRIIQRAFVLAGRDKHVRQHIREAHFTTLWLLQDWNLTWTVVLDRGKFTFERRPAKKPDLVLSWRTAEEFFNQGEDGTPVESTFELEGALELHRFYAPVLKGLFASLRQVLHNPIDDAGESLL